MKINITPSKIKRLWGKMGTRSALAGHLGCTEMAIRLWDSGRVDCNKSGYRFEIYRLLEEHEIN